jgi:8-oxo-dGTP pyrophosphatase MutT (NUDIX family)
MAEPVEPRLAATVLLVRDDPFEVLMVRRAAGGSFASAMVFPGGVVDRDDGNPRWNAYVTGVEGLSRAEQALRIAALREVFEETGLLILAGGSGKPACNASDFHAVVVASGGRLPLDTLVPFARWITPEGAAKRWDTHFFLCAAPVGQEPVCDAVETVAVEWVDPARVVSATRKIVFPTRLNLARLAESSNVSEAFAAAAARPLVTVLPKMERRAEGLYSVIPAEAGYAETEGLIAL